MRHFVSISLALAAAACSVSAQVTYDFIDIGLPPGMTNCSVADIDDAGRVLVYSVTTTPSPWGSRSFIWDPAGGGAFTQVGPYLNYARTEAWQLAPDGTVVGYSYLLAGQFPTTIVAWTWKNSVFTKLPPLGYNMTSAVAINASGLCTGWGYPPNPFTGFTHTIRSTPTSTTPVQNILNLQSGGTAINDAGAVVGYVNSQLNFSWQTASVTCPEGGLHEMGSLGGFGAYTTYAQAMNNLGQVVGSSYIGNEDASQFVGQAFVWKDGVMTKLGGLPGDTTSIAFDINDAGVIVGQSGPSGARHPVMWKNGSTIDLATQTTVPANWKVLSADRLNATGAIAGNGVVSNADRAFVLKPKP